MTKYTIVRSNRLNNFQSKMSKDVVCMNMFDNLPFINKVWLEIMLISHMKIPVAFFNQELLDIASDVIIVFDGHARPEFLKWLVNNNPGKRFIFWCWNTVDEIVNNLKLEEIPEEYELWSYSEYDCNKYDLHYNTTFYWKDYEDLSDGRIENDVCFIGKDKGRYKKAMDLKEQFSEAGIKCNFQIIPTHPWEYKPGMMRKVPYEIVLDNIRKTKAIIDLKVSKTAGPTLRSIEAAFFKKKIVSDDMNIKNMKFYNPHNVFILSGGYNPAELKAFLNSPYMEVNCEDLDYYKIDNWLSRFTELRVH